MKKRNPINYALIDKLAGIGPASTERLTRANMARLADPVAPLAERVQLLQAIVGGWLHYEDAADCLGESCSAVLVAKLNDLGERPWASVFAEAY